MQPAISIASATTRRNFDPGFRQERAGNGPLRIGNFIGHDIETDYA